MDIKQGYFTGRSKITASVVLGFVPDHLDLCTIGSRLVAIHWDGGAQDLSTSSGLIKYGLAEMGTSHLREDPSRFCNYSADVSDCYEVAIGSADFGISALDYDGEYAMIEHPDGTGKVPKAVNQWIAASVLTGTDRADNVVGMLVKPTTSKMGITHNYVYEAIAIDAAGSACDAAEPTWPTAPGVSVVDNDIDWMCRDAHIVRAGGKGFVMGNSVINTQNDLVVFTAYRADTNKYIGDTFDTGEVYLNAPWNKV